MQPIRSGFGRKVLLYSPAPWLASRWNSNRRHGSTGRNHNVLSMPSVLTFKSARHWRPASRRAATRHTAQHAEQPQHAQRAHVQVCQVAAAGVQTVHVQHRLRLVLVERALGGVQLAQVGANRACAAGARSARLSGGTDATGDWAGQQVGRRAGQSSAAGLQPAATR